MQCPDTACFTRDNLRFGLKRSVAAAAAGCEGTFRPIRPARLGPLQARPRSRQAAAAAGEAIETARQPLPAGEEGESAVRADGLEDTAVNARGVADATAGRGYHD